MRTVELNQWLKVGEGGNGTVYESPSYPGIVLKVNKPRINTLSFVQHEFDVCKAVENVGINMPKTLEIVQVGDMYGTFQEKIVNKKSLSRICSDNPARTEEMARVLCEEGKKIFGTPCPTDQFPSRKEQLLNAIGKVKFLTRKEKEAVLDFAYSIPECDGCVHGDFQMGNLVSSEDRYYWIDLDRFAHGDPMFDVGHLYLICHIYSPMGKVQEIFHINEDQFHQFWDAFAKAYTGTEEHGKLDALAGKFALLDLVNRYNFQRPTLLENLFYRSYARKLIKKFYNA